MSGRLRCSIAGTVFALLLVNAFPSAQSSAKPKPKPKETPAAKPSPPRPAAPAAPSATLLIRVDETAMVSVDGEPAQRVEKNQSIKVPVGIGQHIVEAVVPGTDTRWEQTVQVKVAEQLVVKTELANVQSQAAAAEEARRARQAEEAENARRQRGTEAEKQLLGHWTNSQPDADSTNSAGCRFTDHRNARRLLMTGERVPPTGPEYLRGHFIGNYMQNQQWRKLPQFVNGEDRCIGGQYSRLFRATYYFLYEEALGSFRGHFDSPKSSCEGACGGVTDDSGTFTATVSGNQLTIRYSDGVVRTYTRAGG